MHRSNRQPVRENFLSGKWRAGSRWHSALLVLWQAGIMPRCCDSSGRQSRLTAFNKAMARVSAHEYLKVTYAMEC